MLQKDTIIMNNMGPDDDIRTFLDKTQKSLERAIADASLTPEQKEMIRTAMMFGYASAVCEKAYSANGSYKHAQLCLDMYNKMLKKLE